MGIAAGSYKHGRRSKYLPGSIREKYEEARSDPDLLALGEELILLDSRINDVLSRIDFGEAGHWRQTRQAWRAFGAARRQGDTVAMNEALEGLGEAIKAGAATAAAWGEICDLIERRRRLVETEGKRRLAMRTMVTAERLDLLMAQVIQAIEENVTDERVLAGISQSLARFIGDAEPA